MSKSLNAKSKPAQSFAKRESPSASGKSLAAKTGPIPSAGLAGLLIDRSQPAGKRALAPAAGIRSATRSAAAGSAFGIKMLDPESAAQRHLDRAFDSDAAAQFVRPKIETAASAFRSLGSQALPLTGSTLVKFRQEFNKVPVYGSLVSVELDKNNECLAINSSLGAPSGVKHVASVAPAQALKAVAKASGQPFASLKQTPRIYYYFDQDAQKWRLAYIVEDVPKKHRIRLAGGHIQSPLMDYVVDAHSGKLLAELPRLNAMAAVSETVKDALKKSRTISVETLAGGKRRLHDSALNITTHSFDFKDPDRQSAMLPGAVYEKPPAPWPLEAIGAHANATAVAKFLRTVVKRNNIDDQGGPLVSTVNCWDRGESTGTPQEWRNAFWNGNQMVYGQVSFPDGSFFSTASMLDIVAHEMFHGVTDHTSRLEYRTQAGALNESYSDIFGVIVNNYAKPRDRWNWQIGVGFEGPDMALRNMQDPTLLDQPKHMRGFLRYPPPYDDGNDQGGVHSNSGIHNFAAYSIMTAKSVGKHVFNRKELAGLFYIALTAHLSRTSQFADSRRAVVQAAHSLFRNESAASQARKVKAVQDGFAAAGIV